MATHRWEERTRDEIRELAPRAVTVLPVGSTEQHGPHLATATDTSLLGGVIRRACAELPPDLEVLVAPTQPFGASDHHLPFGGTLSLSTATLRLVLGDLFASLRHSGSRRVLLLNGHGGNAATCHTAAADAARELGLLVATASYWELITTPTADESFPGHAGRFETAMMLAERPDLVHLDRTRRSPGAIPPPVVGAHIIPPDFWQQIDGFTDDPSTATRETGKAVIDRCAVALAELLAIVSRLPIPETPP